MDPSRRDFCHPYDPYDIQLQFMSSLYECIEDGKVAIFESPTGTGKSLSLICGSMTWLRERKRKSIENSLEATDNADDPAWMIEAEKQERRKALLRHREELERRFLAARNAETRRKARPAKSLLNNKRLRVDKSNPEESSTTNDDAFVVDDYDSDDQKTSRKEQTDDVSSSTKALLQQLRGPDEAQDNDINLEETKIIFCSRTHSQLSQFVNELRKVKPPSSMALEHEDGTDEIQEVIKHLSLGSRKNLCINPKVSRLKSALAINERCLEIQKPGTSQEHKCSFLPSKEIRAQVETFRDHSLAKIRDIEDLAGVGQSLGVCPYYASRAAINQTEIITLPYPLLLQRSAREALGLSVKNHVIIIDEAHNLMDAVAATYSVEVTLAQLDTAISQVTAYAQKFKNRLRGKNRVYVAQLIRLLAAIAECLRLTASKTRLNEAIINSSQFMTGKGVDQIKPHKLTQYLHVSKLAHKIEGYSQAQRTANEGPDQNFWNSLQSFITVLINPAEEGRFFFARNDGAVSVRYTLLDPREAFRDVVEDARAVILAGGTMSPMTDYADHLFSYLPEGRLRDFSFGHVIPPENLLAQVVGIGPSNGNFEFTFEKRKSELMMQDLGRLVVRVCNVVPDGVVAFFPSYDYLGQVLHAWKRSNSAGSIFELLSNTKVVFEESKAGDKGTDELLRDYTQAVDAGKGALMLSVVGGKLSEGINFSDKLGRAVLAIGLPFPNMHSAEWTAKIEQVEKVRHTQLAETSLPMQDCRAQAQAAGRDFYENACMRAVNQCIGRAIRHRNDYSAILLVDKRFASPRIHKKLPGWIRDSMKVAAAPVTTVELERKLASFFAGKS